MLFCHQEPGVLQHYHRRGVLQTVLVESAFVRFTDMPSARSYAHLRVVTAASVKHFCLQQMFYTVINAA